MNKDRKRIGAASNRFLEALAVSALLAGGGTAMANNSESNRSLEVNAQQQVAAISGVVLDPAGEPVIGASIVEKGVPTNGTITDFDGKFTLKVKEGALLTISYVGYKTQTVKAVNNLRVVLKEDTEVLQEVVVVGYGTQKKENLTGAVSSVDINKTLEGRPIADVGRGLQGSTPGLSVVIPSGEVGSDPTIKIRGQLGSLKGGSAPLILMDNVEIPSIQMVNPDDIESISVLKDAASASIYGAKAAFGVILITTKKGAKTESVNVSYQGNVSWQNLSKKMEMGRIDALGYTVEAFERAGGTVAGAFFQMTREGYEKALEWEKNYGGKLGVNDPYVYGRDWYVDANGRKIGLRTFDPYDYMANEWTPTQNHSLSVNGKSGKTTFNIGLAYLDQNGMMKTAKHDDFKRWNGSIRINTEVNKYLQVHAGSIYSKRDKRYAYATNSTTADPWLYLYRWGPNMPLGYDDEGNILRSPHSETTQANTANIENNYTNLNFGATITPIENWNIDIDYTHANEETIRNRPGTRFTAANTWGGALKKLDANGNQVYVNSAGEVVNAGDPGAMLAYKLNTFEYTGPGSNPDHIYRSALNAKGNTWNVNTNYTWDLDDKNKFKFLLGINRVTYDSADHWAQITNLTDLSNPQFDLTAGTQTSSGNASWESQLGYYGRVNYAFADRYLLEANLRYDGSSKFPKDLQWRWFPSFSAGWRINEESFMQWMQPVVTALKVRGSWGRVGDQTVSNALYIPTMTSGQINWLDASGNKLVGIGTPSAVSSSITWQDIESTDIGLDARFFDNTLGFTFDWFQRDTKNMIVPSDGVSLTFGTGAPQSNYGSLRTRGWEIAIDYNKSFSNGLTVNGMLTLSDAKTKITAYGNTTSIDSWYVGKTYGEIWGYQTDRLYQKDDFVWDGDKIVTTWALNGKEVPAGTAGAKLVNKLSGDNPVYQDWLQAGKFIFGPGDVKYTDLNGDGKIDEGGRSIAVVEDPNDPNYGKQNCGDLKKIGNSTPRYEYGIRLGADFKGFDFSIFMQGIGKRDVWGEGFLVIPGFNSSDGAMPQAIAGDYWREDRTDAFYPRPYNLAGTTNQFNTKPQTRYLLDMSYFRIKNITLGYSFPTQLLKKVGVSKARVYGSLENFFTFDNLNDLPVDPEEITGYSMFNSTNYNMGRTGVGTPTFKSVAVGVQLSF